MNYKPMSPIFLYTKNANLSDADKDRLTAAGYLPILTNSVDDVRVLAAITAPGPHSEGS